MLDTDCQTVSSTGWVSERNSLTCTINLNDKNKVGFSLRHEISYTVSIVLVVGQSIARVRLLNKWNRYLMYVMKQMEEMIGLLDRYLNREEHFCLGNKKQQQFDRTSDRMCFTIFD